MENPIKMDDLGIPLFLETPNYKQFKDTFLLEHPRQDTPMPGKELIEAGKSFGQGNLVCKDEWKNREKLLIGDCT